MRIAMILLVLALQGCELGARLANIPLAFTGARLVHQPYRPELRARKEAGEEISKEELSFWSDQCREDYSACMERGYIYQTASISGGWYQGTGGVQGGTQWNEGVFLACMEARGWRYEKG